jgi:hypothetical protein
MAAQLDADRYNFNALRSYLNNIIPKYFEGNFFKRRKLVFNQFDLIKLKSNSFTEIPFLIARIAK